MIDTVRGKEKKQRFDSKKKDVWMMNERRRDEVGYSLLQQEIFNNKRFSQDAALGVSFFELKE